MDMPNNKPTLPPFGSKGVADFEELLDLLAIVFQSLATADSPRTLQARMWTAASVFRDKYGMEAPRADVFVHRLTYNTRGGYAQRSQASTPLVQSRQPAAQNESWDNSRPRKKREPNR